MPSTTDIAPLNDLLATVYGLSSGADASKKFHTGLLFGLRSRIVQDGRIVPIDGRVLRYCEFMYHDALRHILKLRSERRLELLLHDRSFDCAQHLLTLTKMG